MTINSDGNLVLTGSNLAIPVTNGTTIISGNIDVSAANTNNSSSLPIIQILGDKVGLFAAKINAAGTNGGGTVLVGGDYQGTGTIPHASYTFVSNDSVINVDALQKGDGGKVITWSDIGTNFNGTITARGGTDSGNGGLVEVSGKQNLSFNGIVDTLAPKGQAGSLLLDPQNITIQSPGIGSPLGQTFAFNIGGTEVITGANLSAALNLSNITLQANTDIAFNDNVTVTTFGNSLTLQAGRSITFNGSNFVSLNGGNFTATINDANAIAGDRTVGNATFTMAAGSQILTNGGNVAISHGDRTAFGNGNIGSVDLSGATINSGTGSINITGTTQTINPANVGISVGNGSLLQATGAGNISLTGTGGGTDNNYGVQVDGGGGTRISVQNGNLNLIGRNNAVGIGNLGVYLDTGAIVEAVGTGNVTLDGIGGAGTLGNRGIFINANSIVRSASGNVNLTGVGQGTGIANYGIEILAGSIIESTAGGNINLTGTGANNEYGIYFLNASTNQSAGSGTGNITMTADEIQFAGTSQIKGSGILQLQPLTPSLGITVGGTTNDTRLNLEATDLAAVQTGFSQVIIGRNDGSGAISLDGNTTFNNPLLLQSPVGAGSIDTSAFALTGANNASLSLLANQNITTGNISNPGRAINLTSTSGNVNTTAGILSTSFTTGSGGDVTITAGGNITTQRIDTGGGLRSGNITLNSGGAINTTGGTISSTFGNTVLTNSAFGGNISFTAAGNITTADVTSGILPYTNSGGNISLTSTGASVQTNNLSASGVNSSGTITISSANLLTANNINTNATTGNSGAVNLTATNNLQVNYINAQGGSSGTGGTVNLTTGQFLQATGTFSDRNGTLASISTAGGNGGGAITIRHNGGFVNTPFIVGNAATNGTAGAITSGEFTISPLQSFPFSYTKGNIQIITANPDTSGINAPVGDRLLESDHELPDLEIDPLFDYIEDLFTAQFEEHLNKSDETSLITLTQAQESLRKVESATGIKPALVYVVFAPKVLGVKASDAEQQLAPGENKRDRAQDQLELLVVSGKGKVIRKRVGVTRSQVLPIADQFRSEVTNTKSPRGYLATSQKLYQWLIAPIEPDLQALGIQNLVFLMDSKLRSLPMAALHNQESFLIEKYSIGLMPSLSLTDTRYVDIKKAQLLSMGAATFSNQNPLPAVPEELANITATWTGKSFLNQEFTLNNLKYQRQQQPFGIIHLATHGEFKAGKIENSYIQLWDRQLRLDQLGQLGWNDPPVELLVLSACRTALGDEEAELGFAGLAVQAGVKTAIGSLWYVSDEGTLGLMTEFYQQLQQAPIKAEALRQAQIAMLKGEIRIEGGQLHLPGGNLPLPPELAKIDKRNLTHPYYWSAFTAIGSPW